MVLRLRWSVALIGLYGSLPLCIPQTASAQAYLGPPQGGKYFQVVADQSHARVRRVDSNIAWDDHNGFLAYDSTTQNIFVSFAGRRRCLVASDDEVILHKGSSCMAWPRRFHSNAGDGPRFRLTPAHDDRCLTWPYDDGSPLVLVGCNGSENQLWSLY
jgi:hypothetical protein